MNAQSLGSPNRDSFGTPLWESQEKKPFGCRCGEVTRRTPGEGEEESAPSNIRIIQEVHGGEVVPPNGGTVRPENVKVKPLFSKGELDANLSIRVFGRAVGSNGLPSGHTDLNRRHPGLENFLKGVMVIEVFFTSF